MAADHAFEPVGEITPQQQRILSMIRDWINQYGYAPTIREIGAAVGLASPSSVAHHLKALQAHGLLKRRPHGPRAVDARIAPAVSTTRDRRDGVVVVPVLGEIAAGPPSSRSNPWRKTLSCRWL